MAKPEEAAAAPKVGALPDVYRNYNFMLSSREMGDVRFTECFGLGVRIHPIRYRESGSGQIVRTLPGPSNTPRSRCATA
jgi:hypothetical protein